MFDIGQWARNLCFEQYTRKKIIQYNRRCRTFLCSARLCFKVEINIATNKKQGAVFHQPNKCTWYVCKCVTSCISSLSKNVPKPWQSDLLKKREYNTYLLRNLNYGTCQNVMKKSVAKGEDMNCGKKQQKA